MKWRAYTPCIHLFIYYLENAGKKSKLGEWERRRSRYSSERTETKARNTRRVRTRRGTVHRQQLIGWRFVSCDWRCEHERDVEERLMHACTDSHSCSETRAGTIHLCAKFSSTFATSSSSNQAINCTCWQQKMDDTCNTLHHEVLSVKILKTTFESSHLEPVRRKGVLHSICQNRPIF
jgi:hypothetical protein